MYMLIYVYYENYKYYGRDIETSAFKYVLLNLYCVQ